MQEQFLRFPQIKQRTGLGKTTVYRAMSRDKFPKPLKLYKRVAVWLASDVDAWMQARVTEMLAARAKSEAAERAKLDAAKKIETAQAQREAA